MISESVHDMHSSAAQNIDNIVNGTAEIMGNSLSKQPESIKKLTECVQRCPVFGPERMGGYRIVTIKRIV
jgi:hypothetical protein